MTISVRPLEWPPEIRRGQRVTSKGGLVRYTIAHYGGSEPDSGVVYRWGAEGEAWSEALFAYEHAIRAAQADYAARIRSALASPASVTDGAVEAAARALAARSVSRVSPTSEHIIDKGWVIYSEDARAALLAALPHMQTSPSYGKDAAGQK